MCNPLFTSLLAGKMGWRESSLMAVFPALSALSGPEGQQSTRCGEDGVGHATCPCGYHYASQYQASCHGTRYTPEHSRGACLHTQSEVVSMRVVFHIIKWVHNCNLIFFCSAMVQSSVTQDLNEEVETLVKSRIPSKEKVFGDLDTNKDGKITASELSLRLQVLQQAEDFKNAHATNSTTSEYGNMAKLQRDPPIALTVIFCLPCPHSTSFHPMQRSFTRSVSSNATQKDFANFDVNTDGKVSLEEFHGREATMSIAALMAEVICAAPRCINVMTPCTTVKTSVTVHARVP